MTQELLAVINKYRNEGVFISDEEAEDICKFCLRKMEITNIPNKEEYLPMLYEDELKNYLFRRAVNATSMLYRIEKEGIDNVQCM